MDKAGPTKRAKQKRNRIITACYDCREHGRTCIYLDPPNHALINGTSRKVASLPSEIKDKVTKLYSQCLGDTKDEDDASDYDCLEASPLVTDSASYDDDADDTGVTDLGFRIGKVQLTDRVGGQYRPGMAHELKMLLQGTSQQPEWAEEQAAWPTPPGTFDTGITTPTASFLRPSPSYLAPNLNLFASGTSDELINYLPPFPTSTRILKQYWESVHPVARILHRPSFETRWQAFADDLKAKNRPAKSLQAIIFAILFSGIAAMPPGTLDRELGEDQQFWMQRLQTGTEYALSQAQMIQTTKVETLQAFVAYLMILCRAEVSRVHSALVAAAIRVAECNGLHCDGEQRGYNTIETHVRRLIWFNLCFLDIRTSEAQGPRPIIRVEDYTTKFPANINDADLTKSGHLTPVDGKWAEMTVSLVRFRCNEFIRSIWVARRQLLTREISVTSVINSIESFRLEWSLKLAPDNPNDPLQRYGLCVLDLQTLRTYAMVLHPYHMHPKLQMPDRLLSVLIDNGIKTMDKVIEIETFEDFASWRWYAGALQQHHYALLMATEIIMNPRRKESRRIWKGLDYVFEPPPLPPIARARWVLTQAWWKMEVYVGKRQLRAPINLEQNLQEALKLAEDKPREGRQSSASTEATLVDENSPQPAQGQAAKRQPNQGQSAKKRTASSNVKSGRGEAASTSPKASRGLDGAQIRSPQNNKSGGFTDNPTPQPSPPVGAPPKQIVDVDWGVLNNYYPPEIYTDDLDLPFEMWTQLLQSTPFPTGNEQRNIAPDPPGQYAFQYDSDASAFAPVPGQLDPENSRGSWRGPLPSTQSGSATGQYIADYSADYSAPQTQHQQPRALWSSNEQANNTHWSQTYQTQQPHQSSFHQQTYQQQFGAQQQTSQQQWSGEPPSQQYGSAATKHQQPRQPQAQEPNFNMGFYQPIQRLPR
ncbi:MAG: hypothetical protein Q9217_000467 [Psora testacea]